MEPENPGMEMAKAFAEGAGKEGVDKISGLLGALVPFWGLKRRAVDNYVRDIQQSNLSPEAKMMAIANTKKKFRELKNQSAVLDVAYNALGEGENIDAESLDNADHDLIDRLVDSSRFVSDEELQLLWGNVLAGEFEHPGMTPKNIVRILSELSKEYASVFSRLCSLQVDILADTGDKMLSLGPAMIIFDEYMQEIGIDKDSIRELAQLGLVSFIDIGNYTITLPENIFPYFHIICKDHVMTAMNCKGSFIKGQIILTKAGQSISRFVPVHYNQQYMEKIRVYLEKRGNLKFLPVPSIHITEIQEEKGICTGYSYERLPIELPQTEAQI